MSLAEFSAATAKAGKFASRISRPLSFHAHRIDLRAFA